MPRRPRRRRRVPFANWARIQDKLPALLRDPEVPLHVVKHAVSTDPLLTVALASSPRHAESCHSPYQRNQPISRAVVVPTRNSSSSLGGTSSPGVMTRPRVMTSTVRCGYSGTSSGSPRPSGSWAVPSEA